MFLQTVLEDWSSAKIAGGTPAGGSPPQGAGRRGAGVFQLTFVQTLLAASSDFNMLCYHKVRAMTAHIRTLRYMLRLQRARLFVMPPFTQ